MAPRLRALPDLPFEIVLLTQAVPADRAALGRALRSDGRIRQKPGDSARFTPWE